MEVAAPLIWLTVYLAIGTLVLLACSRTPACRYAHRMERNRRITGLFSFSAKRPDGPVPGPVQRVPASH
jgi:hypothetical protein